MMGEPIYLVKTDEKGKEVGKETAYGPAQAATLRAKGYAYATDKPPTAEVSADDLTKLEGVTDTIAEAMVNAGMLTYADVIEAPLEKLTALPGVANATAGKIKASAAKLAA